MEDSPYGLIPWQREDREGVEPKPLRHLTPTPPTSAGFDGSLSNRE